MKPTKKKVEITITGEPATGEHILMHIINEALLKYEVNAIINDDEYKYDYPKSNDYTCIAMNNLKDKIDVEIKIVQLPNPDAIKRKK